MASSLPAELRSRLRSQLPSSATLVFHYIRSAPSSCDPIYAAPPHALAEPTTCESHFLSASVSPSSSDEIVQVFAVEVLVYNTASLTTLFVSKADSSGFLAAAELPHGGRAIAKGVSRSFLEYLVVHRRDASKRLVISLFARAQAQYLFPGSVENVGKHVLDDRRLIRWWCGIFDAVLASSISSGSNHTSASPKAFLAIPGLDTHETRTYWPRVSAAEWHADNPLRQFVSSLNVPTRCLIPRFPDDPKARFALDLDDELPENGPQPPMSPEKRPPGQWRSVRSLEQFWEMMAFRQECSAGRVVGFLWGVFEPEAGAASIPTILHTSASPTTANGEAANTNGSGEGQAKGAGTMTEPKMAETVPVTTSAEGDTTTQQPSPPLPTAGALAVDSKVYAEITELLTQLDYANLDLAKESTKRFLSNAAGKARVDPAWGATITGNATLTTYTPRDLGNPNNESLAVNTLGAGLIRKRKKSKPEQIEPAAAPKEKKAKTEV